MAKACGLCGIFLRNEKKTTNFSSYFDHNINFFFFLIYLLISLLFHLSLVSSQMGKVEREPVGFRRITDRLLVTFSEWLILSKSGVGKLIYVTGYRTSNWEEFELSRTCVNSPLFIFIKSPSYVRLFLFLYLICILCWKIFTRLNHFFLLTREPHFKLSKLYLFHGFHGTYLHTLMMYLCRGHV